MIAAARRYPFTRFYLRFTESGATLITVFAVITL
ncbi:hypothetical protein TH47_08565 [Thalassospira sp. MCCC 1A02803]|nr:hypothetical protein TH47_08565 [Thalassospira sp. MCCC 1A02803]